MDVKIDSSTQEKTLGFAQSKRGSGITEQVEKENYEREIGGFR